MRVIICVMMFTACWTSYTCRLQMSILVVPMIGKLNRTELPSACASENKATISQPGASEPAAGQLKKLWLNEDELLFQYAHQSYKERYKRNAESSGMKSFMGSNKKFDWSPDIRGKFRIILFS